MTETNCTNSQIISDVDNPIGSTPSSSNNDKGNQQIMNLTDGYENDNGIINPVVGHEKQSEHIERRSGCGIDVTNTTPKFGCNCSSMRDGDLIGSNLSSDSCS